MTEDRQSQIANRKPQILLIEDNENNRYLTTFILEKHGYEVFQAVDGQAGIALASQLKPDLILLDIQLPVMDGYAVARALTQNLALQDIPIIAVTSYAMAGDRERVLAAGCAGYIEKPINPETFVTEVEQHLSPRYREACRKSAVTKILIVDDEPQNLYLLQALLSANGYTVERAANGAEALALARQAAPDLIVSDILMPVLDGFALCRAWREDARLKHIPFVFHTATYTDAKDEAFALSLGADRFIVKPAEPDALLAALRETLAPRASDSPTPPREMLGSESEYYQEYSAALIRKLETKMRQLQAANRALELDIAQRIQAETRLRTLNRMYAMLSDINQAIVRIREPKALYDRICRVGVELGGFRLVWIGFLEESGQLQVVAHAGGTAAYFEQAEITIRVAPAAHCPIQSALCSGQRVVCNAAEATAPCQRIAAQLGVLSTTAFPLHVLGRLRGAVTFYADQPDFVDEDEIGLLDELVQDLAFALEFAEKEAERKRSEEALRASEHRLRRFYESGMIGVIYWNMDGAILDANDKFLEMVGYSREDLAAGRLNGFQMTPPEYQYMDELSMTELQATGVNRAPFEKEYLRKDGTRVPITLAGAMLDEERFNGVAFVLDITERKQAEAQLTEQLNELRRWYNATLGRETRILDLKREVNELLAQAGQPPRYASAE